MMALPAQYFLNPSIERECYTEEEYFAWEMNSFGRWEWVPDGSMDAEGRPLGVIRAMGGGMPHHSAIAMNLGRALGNALDAEGVQTCNVYGSDLKIQTADRRNTFPDVSVVCGALSFYGTRLDVITNPILIAEVLSPSTQEYDRGEKWLSYQTIPTLQHYLLVSADRVRVELYTRQEQGWHFAAYEGLEAQVHLSALDMTLSLSSIYIRVNFSGGTL